MNELGTAGAFSWGHQFGEGPLGQPASEALINGFDAGGQGRGNHPLRCHPEPSLWQAFGQELPQFDDLGVGGHGSDRNRAGGSV